MITLCFECKCNYYCDWMTIKCNDSQILNINHLMSLFDFSGKKYVTDDIVGFIQQMTNSD